MGFPNKIKQRVLLDYFMLKDYRLATATSANTWNPSVI